MERRPALIGLLAAGVGTFAIAGIGDLFSWSEGMVTGALVVLLAGVIYFGGARPSIKAQRRENARSQRARPL
jgi:hypothetical protein